MTDTEKPEARDVELRSDEVADRLEQAAIDMDGPDCFDLASDDLREAVAVLRSLTPTVACPTCAGTGRVTAADGPMTPDTEPSPEARVERALDELGKAVCDANLPSGSFSAQDRRRIREALDEGQAALAAARASSPPTGERCPTCGSYERDVCRHGGKASSAHILGPKMLHPKPCCDDPFHEPAPTEQRTERDELAALLEARYDEAEENAADPKCDRKIAQGVMEGLQFAMGLLARSTPPNEEGRIDPEDLAQIELFLSISHNADEAKLAKSIRAALAALSGEGEK